MLGIHPLGGFPGVNDLIQREPLRHELSGNMGKKGSMIARLAGNQKCGAFPRELIADALLGQESQAGQRIADGVHATQGRARLLRKLCRRARTRVQKIEQLMFDRRLNNERRRISPAQLHETFRCQGGWFARFIIRGHDDDWQDMYFL
jgi:hypothetical protein